MLGSGLFIAWSHDSSDSHNTSPTDDENRKPAAATTKKTGILPGLADKETLRASLFGASNPSDENRAPSVRGTFAGLSNMHTPSTATPLSGQSSNNNVRLDLEGNVIPSWLIPKLDMTEEQLNAIWEKEVDRFLQDFSAEKKRLS